MWIKVEVMQVMMEEGKEGRKRREGGREGGRFQIVLESFSQECLGEAEGMAQQLRALAALAEDLGSIPAPTWQLTTFCKSSSRGICYSHRCTYIQSSNTLIHIK